MSAAAYDLVHTTLLGEAAEAAPIAILVADEDGRYVAVNRFACELLGYEREELMRLQVADVSPSTASAEQFEEMLRRGSLSGEARLVGKDGRELVVAFDAYSTRVAQTLVYVSFVRPLAGEL